MSPSTRLILFGAPGAGKGTLAERIKKLVPVAHISTGDLFRENIKNGTPIGKEAKQFMDDGKLVPDSVVIGMVKERLKASDVKNHGFMLDGFPRTLEQAKELDTVTGIDVVAVLDIDKGVLMKRIIGRWSCPSCNRIYNIYSPELKPKVECKCDACTGTDLVHRSDDNEETFEKRWSTYLEQSEAVISYYEQKGIVVHLDATLNLERTDDDLRRLLKL